MKISLLLLPLLAVAAVLGYGLSSPDSTLLGPALARGPAQARQVALTFDDGPSVPFTGQILDILRASHVRATFFLCGANAERHPDLVRRIRAEGHGIGNHTYSHPYLVLKSRDNIAGEIDRAQDILERLSGRRPRLFRPPFGVRWFSLSSLLRERGMTLALWSIRAYDGRYDAESIVKTTLKQLRPGAIIVLHDGFETQPPELIDRSATVRALPSLIAGIRGAGYHFAPLPD